MSRRLDDLSDRFRPMAFEFIARLTEAGIPVMVIDTLRTPEEQAENIIDELQAGIDLLNDALRDYDNLTN